MLTFNFKERLAQIKEEEVTTLKDTLSVFNNHVEFPYNGEHEMPTILINLNSMENLIVSAVVLSIEMTEDCKLVFTGTCEEFGAIYFGDDDIFPGEIETILECIFMNSNN
jgi:hypothetical protein